MEKRTVVITGGNTGLGFKCAQNIARKSKDYQVLIACRNRDKANVAKENLKQETGNPHIYAHELDLASLESIRNFYKAFCDGNFPPLYALVCNAGVHGNGMTKDGFEETFGVNHLGHYLLANLLLNQMINEGRIVFVTSDMHDPPRFLPFRKPIYKSAKLLAYPERNDKTPRYSTSKFCNILCTYEMSNRLSAETEKQITINAFNPGFMPDTGLVEALGPVAGMIIPRLISLFASLIGSGSNVEKSGRALADMITDKQYKSITGTYNDRGKIIKSSKASYDKTAA